MIQQLSARILYKS